MVYFLKDIIKTKITCFIIYSCSKHIPFNLQLQGKLHSNININLR